MRKLFTIIAITLAVLFVSCSAEGTSPSASLTVSAGLEKTASRGAIEGSTADVTHYDIVVYKGTDKTAVYTSDRYQLTTSVTVNGLMAGTTYRIRSNGYTSAEGGSAAVYGEAEITPKPGTNEITLTLDSVEGLDPTPVTLTVTLPDGFEAGENPSFAVELDGTAVDDLKAESAEAGGWMLSFTATPGVHVAVVTVTGTSETLSTVAVLRGFPAETVTAEVGFEVENERQNVVGVMIDFTKHSDESLNTFMDFIYRLYTSETAAENSERHDETDLRFGTNLAISDPNDVVGIDITTEPAVYSGSSSAGSSLFNDISPWKDMKLIARDSTDGSLTDTYDGQETIGAFLDEHSDACDFFVDLPDLYYVIYDDADGSTLEGVTGLEDHSVRYYYVSGESFTAEIDGESVESSLHPGSEYDVGVFLAQSSEIPDKTNDLTDYYYYAYGAQGAKEIEGIRIDRGSDGPIYSRPIGNGSLLLGMTKETADDYVSARNTADVRGEYSLYKAEVHSYLQMLYMVEFGRLGFDADSGPVGESTKIDASYDFSYHTVNEGSGGHAMYRHIDQPFGAKYAIVLTDITVTDIKKDSPAGFTLTMPGQNRIVLEGLNDGGAGFHRYWSMFSSFADMPWLFGMPGAYPGENYGAAGGGTEVQELDGAWYLPSTSLPTQYLLFGYNTAATNWGAGPFVFIIAPCNGFAKSSSFSNDRGNPSGEVDHLVSTRLVYKAGGGS